MESGDLVRVVNLYSQTTGGIGVYLGYELSLDLGGKLYEVFWWKGRVATFDPTYWMFEVVSESR